FEALGECSGVVRDAGGRPLAGVEVAATIVADLAQVRRLTPSAWVATGTTDGQGRYRLRGLLPALGASAARRPTCRPAARRPPTSCGAERCARARNNLRRAPPSACSSQRQRGS